MTIVTLSPKYQLVIPKEIRRKLKLTPGQKFDVVEQGGQVYVVPVLPIERLRGRWPGVHKGWERDEEDRV
jgi:AbrB family looped-hinge helix DNA binding protein